MSYEPLALKKASQRPLLTLQVSWSKQSWGVDFAALPIRTLSINRSTHTKAPCGGHPPQKWLARTIQLQGPEHNGPKSQPFRPGAPGSNPKPSVTGRYCALISVLQAISFWFLPRLNVTAIGKAKHTACRAFFWTAKNLFDTAIAIKRAIHA